MATPEAIGTAACADCSTLVHVAKNRSGFAFYRCGRCGVEHRHHTHTASERFIREKVTLFEPEKPDEDSAPPPENPGKTTLKKGGFATLLGVRS